MYCNGFCGKHGDEEMGCQQSDADVYCKLKMCDETAFAISYNLAIASSDPGFGCKGYGKDMGEWFGIPSVTFESNIVSSHGLGQVIKDVTCEIPESK